MRWMAEKLHTDDGTLAGIVALLFAFIAGFVTLQNAEPAQAQFPFETARVARSNGAQPLVALDALGIPATFVSESMPNAPLYRTIDHGVSFERAGTLPPLNDITGIAFDARGRLYAAGAHLSIARSTNVGRAWTSLHPVARGRYGRAWLTARGNGAIVVSAIDERAHKLRAWLSWNAARTFRGPYTIPASAELAGPLLVGPYGSLHQAFIGNARDGKHYVGYAASADGGRTWSAQAVGGISDAGARAASADDALRAPKVAVDDQGTLYVTWVDIVAAVPRAIVSISSDHGASWPAFRVLSSDSTSVGPTPVAGGPGRIDISFVRADPKGGWDLVMMQTTQGANLIPAFATAVIARDVSQGSTMLGDLNGTALIAYGANGNEMVARQASGTKLH